MRAEPDVAGDWYEAGWLLLEHEQRANALRPGGCKCEKALCVKANFPLLTT